MVPLGLVLVHGLRARSSVSHSGSRVPDHLDLARDLDHPVNQGQERHLIQHDRADQYDHPVPLAPDQCHRDRPLVHPDSLDRHHSDNLDQMARDRHPHLVQIHNKTDPRKLIHFQKTE